jgi:hypothetical protein
MQERGWIEPIVERVVGEVLDSHAAQIRAEIVRRVIEEIEAAAPANQAAQANDNQTSTTAGAGTADLARAVAEIQLGNSQKEILRALLDASSRFAARVALFVVKGSHATGWQARGFANSDGVKDFALDESAPAVARAIGDRVAANASASELDSRFLNDFGMPATGEARILPLILKDKVAALIYADGGTAAGGQLDAGSLELLVLSTGAWLEINSLRKQAQNHADSRSVAAAEPPSSSASIVQPFNDPFASHAPAFAATGHAMAAAASAGDISAPPVTSAAAQALAPAPAPAIEHHQPEPQKVESHNALAELHSAVVEVDPPLAEALPLGHAESDSLSESSPSPSMSPEDQDVHRKAQRFSRLLVDEIKLYNQAKVAEGRKNKDLYDRLKEAIEKSRATYQKRYGNTVAASANYFQHEIIRSLAEDDLSIMGANFRQ